MGLTGIGLGSKFRVIFERIKKMTESTNTATATEICPDCDSVVGQDNELIADYYNPEAYGSCVNCYDPTPEGIEYQEGFEMEHNCLAGTGCCGKTR